MPRPISQAGARRRMGDAGPTPGQKPQPHPPRAEQGFSRCGSDEPTQGDLKLRLISAPNRTRCVTTSPQGRHLHRAGNLYEGPSRRLRAPPKYGSEARIRLNIWAAPASPISPCDNSMQHRKSSAGIPSKRPSDASPDPRALVPSLALLPGGDPSVFLQDLPAQEILSPDGRRPPRPPFWINHQVSPPSC